MWTGYYASVAFMDVKWGAFSVRWTTGLRSTAVVFASDRGYHLGERLLAEINLHEEVTACH